MENAIKEIAVLMTCHNRKIKTLSSLAALYKCVLNEGYTFDVFVVDDGCTDGTPDAIRFQFGEVNIIKGCGDLFWNRGTHLAWVTAVDRKEYDYFLWLNDDTILFQHALVELLQCSVSRDDTSIFCGTTCDTNNPSIITYGGRVNKGLICPNGQIQTCDVINGNIVLIPRFVYNQVGMNDPKFHHAIGDTDYSLRAKKLGIKSLVSKSVLGECDEHKHLAAWCDPQTPFIKRVISLYGPLGNNPFEYFIFNKRHYGIFKALYFFFTCHLRSFFPTIWTRRYKF